MFFFRVIIAGGYLPGSWFIVEYTFLVYSREKNRTATKFGVENYQRVILKQKALQQSEWKETG